MKANSKKYFTPDRESYRAAKERLPFFAALHSRASLPGIAHSGGICYNFRAGPRRGQPTFTLWGQKMRKKINLNKATWFSIVINSIQILLAGAIGLIVVLRGDQVLNGAVEQAVVGVMAAIVVWGAVVDIRDAHYARKVADESGHFLPPQPPVAG